MDDRAASQQLMDETGEQTRRTNGGDARLAQVDGADDIPRSGSRKFKTRRARRIAKKRLATSLAASRHGPPEKTAPAPPPQSSPFPFPPTQSDRDGVPSSAAAIEVPDSQVGSAPAHAPMSPPISSLVVPSSLTQGKRTYKKSKQSKRFDVLRGIGPTQDSDGEGDTTKSAAEPVSPSYAPSKRKRPRVSYTEPGLLEDAEGAQDAAVPQLGGAVEDNAAGTPTSTKRRKIAKSMQGNIVRELILPGEGNVEDHLDNGESPQIEKKKLRRVRKLKSHQPLAKNIYDIPDDEPRTVNAKDETLGAGREHRSDIDRDGEEANIPEESTRKTRGIRKKRKKDHEIYDWPVSVRQPGEPGVGISDLDDDNYDDDAIMREPASSDDDIFADPSSNRQYTTRKAKKKRKPRSKAFTRRASVIPARVRKSKTISADTITSAEKALDTDRELGHPPDLRRSGEFTQDEEELIRRAIRDYQQRRGLETSDLVDIIQWTSDSNDPRPGRRKSDRTPQETEDARESAEFWGEIMNTGLLRPITSVRTHVRGVYHQYRTGGWTEEEDEELRNLYALHPNMWKIISTSLGDRSTQDCQNRWRDYVQYGERRNTSTWSKEEEELLIRAVTTVAQRDEDYRAESGKPALDEYTNKDINWPQVSLEMGGIRSRIQASVKWTKMKKRGSPPQIQVDYKPRKITSSPPKNKLGRSQRNEELGTGQKKRRKSKLTKAVIQDSEQEEEHDVNQEERDELKSTANSEASSTPPGSKTAPATTPDPEEQPEEEEGIDSELQRGIREDTAALKKRRTSETGRTTALVTARDPEQNEENVAEGVEEQEEEVPESEDEEAEQSLGVAGTEEDSAEDAEDSTDDKEDSAEDEEDVKEHEEDSAEAKEDSTDDEEDSAEDKEDSTDDEEDVKEHGQGGVVVQEEQSVQDEEESSVDSISQHDERSAQSHEEDTSSEPDDSSVQDQEEGNIQGRDSAADLTTAKSTPSPKKRGKPKKSRVVSPTTRTPGVEHMLWGDKFDLMYAIADRRDEDAEDIDWKDLAKQQQNYAWTPQTLQAALHQLVQLLRDNGKEVDMDDFPGTVDDIVDFLMQEHAEELEQHYDPDRNVASESDDERSESSSQRKTTESEQVTSESDDDDASDSES
ncbi:hypothetical protein BDW02DRAFT_568699 [Decorospora gaudefroyi]|uniref:Myb-like DNA-binding domain-containing protein n=1 Tax=Decorospora gaudefroyi TaxID=184978 RepID=A0A6A5KGE2_9PLEO|nr:hypothetical protein BDW02DRAFT_568699 [Decorospora gaudefroyi]